MTTSFEVCTNEVDIENESVPELGTRLTPSRSVTMFGKNDWYKGDTNATPAASNVTPAHASVVFVLSLCRGIALWCTLHALSMLPCGVVPGADGSSTCFREAGACTPNPNPNPDPTPNPNPDPNLTPYQLNSIARLSNSKN